MKADDLQSQKSLCLSFSLKETISFFCLHNNYEDLFFLLSLLRIFSFSQKTNFLIALSSSTDPDRNLIHPFQPTPKQFRRELSNATDRFKIGVQTEEKSEKES